MAREGVVLRTKQSRGPSARILLSRFGLFLLIACARSGTYRVGGSVSGLLGSGLVLQNNAGDNLAIDGNGPFRFSTTMRGGDHFDVTVLMQPNNPAQTCHTGNGVGSISGADVASVTVVCVTNNYLIGGTIAGDSASGRDS